MQTTQHRSTWDTYTNAWSQTDPQSRADLLVACADVNVEYTDPSMQATGHAALSAYMAAVQNDVPGVRFVVTDYASHHGRSLVHWNMVDGQGHVLTPGISHAGFGPDGKLLQLTGFFGPVTSANA